MRSMNKVALNLDEFGRHGLEDLLRRRGGSRTAAVRSASLYYLADRATQRPAWRVPGFARAAGRRRGDMVSHTVRFDEETWRALSEEAIRQDVSREALVGHAILYFLADLDRRHAHEVAKHGDLPLLFGDVPERIA